MTIEILETIRQGFFFSLGFMGGIAAIGLAFLGLFIIIAVIQDLVRR